MAGWGRRFRVAIQGRQGLARTVPEKFESGSDVAIMTLLGYDPAKYHTGRAPLEAAAQRIPLSPTDWVFRCNLVTVLNGIMKDHSAGGITDAEARRLLDDLKKSIDMGFQEFELMKTDPDLKPFQELPEFQELIKNAPQDPPAAGARPNNARAKAAIRLR